MSNSEELSIHYRQPTKASTSEERFLGDDSHDSSKFERLEAELSTEPASDEAGATDWAICGLTSNHARDDVQRVLLNEWFTGEPWRLEPGVRDLFAHFMHDNLVSERSTRTA